MTSRTGGGGTFFVSTLASNSEQQDRTSATLAGDSTLYAHIPVPEAIVVADFASPAPLIDTPPAFAIESAGSGVQATLVGASSLTANSEQAWTTRATLVGDSSLTSNSEQAWTTRATLADASTLAALIYGYRTDGQVFKPYNNLITIWPDWQGSTLRQRFESSVITDIAQTSLQVILEFGAGTDGQIDACYVGHAANSGDLYDFAGDQVQVLFNDITTKVVSGRSSVVGYVTFNVDATRALIVSIAFSGTKINLLTETEFMTIAGGRLTLTSGVPVLSATVSGATTVYYTPYVSQYIPIYNGSVITLTDLGGELSQATTDATKSPAACTTNSNYDLFVWNDGGTFRCTRGPAWTSNTARGAGAGTTELIRVKGVELNANNITNGPLAQRGTYIGTVRTNASSQVDWIYGASGTPAIFGVWNNYNRCLVSTRVLDSAASWTYNSATYQGANASDTTRVSFVSGLAEDMFEAFYIQATAVGAGLQTSIGIGYDSNTAVSGVVGDNNAGVTTTTTAWYGTTSLGFHYFEGLESLSLGSGTATFYGNLTGSNRRGVPGCKHFCR